MFSTILSTLHQPEEISKKNMLRLVLILGALTAFTSMSIDMYLPAFPAMAKDLGVPIGTIQLSISAFLFGSAAGQLIYGPLADRWGRRFPLMLGLVLYIISSIGCALVRTAEGLLFWRLVMAVGGGAGMVISRAIVRDLYDTAEAARIFSLLMLVMGSAPILAPMAGGQLLLVTGWRGIFGFLGVFGLLSLIAALRYLPESLPEERRNRSSLAQLTGNYWQIILNRQYVRYAIALGCIAGVTFSYIAGAPQLFIELHGITPQHFGVFFGANAMGLIGASQINRRLLHHFSAERILRAAFFCNVASGIFLMLSVMSGYGGFTLQIVLLFACLSTAGLIYPNVTALAMAPFQNMAGSASALLGTIQYALGATAGAAVSLLQSGTGVTMTIVMAGCGVIGCLAIAGCGRKQCLQKYSPINPSLNCGES